MTCRTEVFSSHEILEVAAEGLADVLADVRRAVNDPDYWGEEWYEVYLGNPLLPTYVVVDLIGNAVHVTRQRRRSPGSD